MVVSWQPNTIDDQYIVQYRLNGSVSYTISDPVSACFIHSILNCDKAQPHTVQYLYVPITLLLCVASKFIFIVQVCVCVLYVCLYVIV